MGSSVLLEVLSSGEGASSQLQSSMGSGRSARPLLNEIALSDNDGPFLATNAASTFVLTRRSSTRGVVRYGFSKVPLDEESHLIPELYMSLLSISWVERWQNRCNTIRDGVSRMVRNSLEPLNLMVSKESEEKLNLPNIKVIPSDLAPGCALLTASRSLSGLYSRVGDYLGVMVLRADTAWMVIGDDVA